MASPSPEPPQLDPNVGLALVRASGAQSVRGNSMRPALPPGLVAHLGAAAENFREVTQGNVKMSDDELTNDGKTPSTAQPTTLFR